MKCFIYDLWYWLKKIFFCINKNVFNIVCWLSILLIVYLIIITLIVLSEYPVDFFSKNSVKFFFDAFDWCKSYIAACFVLYPIYFTLNTYRMQKDDKIYNNIVKPHTESLSSRLITIKQKNLKMFEYFDHHGKQIIAAIIDNEKKRRVKSQETLKIYFDKFIKKHISNFEYCGYNYCDCENKICTEDCNKSEPTYCAKDPHSIREFKAIAYELFYIDPSYDKFYDDIEQLYKENIESSRYVRLNLST